MKIGIAMPWRPQPTRVYAFEATVERYKTLLPDVDFYFGDTGSERWNMSGSRNQACDKAIADGCDVVVVSDADTFVDSYALNKCIEIAYKQDVVTVPYTRLCMLNEEGSNALVAGEIKINDAWHYSAVYHNQVGGIFILSPKTYEILNGWDERFIGWGFEDLAFQESHKTLLECDFIRVSAVAVTLYHEDRDKGSLESNESLYRNYQSLLNNKTEMARLVEGNRRRND